MYPLRTVQNVESVLCNPWGWPARPQYIYIDIFSFVLFNDTAPSVSRIIFLSYICGVDLDLKWNSWKWNGSRTEVRWKLTPDWNSIPNRGVSFQYRIEEGKKQPTQIRLVNTPLLETPYSYFALFSFYLFDFLFRLSNYLRLLPPGYFYLRYLGSGPRSIYFSSLVGQDQEHFSFLITSEGVEIFLGSIINPIY
jgi:hypothetical protein